MQRFRLLIDGRLEDGAGALDVIEPATGQVFARAPAADGEQLERAVAAAQSAFPAWAATDLAARRAALHAIAEALEARMDEFALLLTREQGKPLAQSIGEIYGAVAALRMLSQPDLPLEVLRDSAGGQVLRQRRPLGVVAAITPWNFPVLLLAAKLAPALLAGNTVVAKPAPTTPLTSLLLGEICAEQLPPGVLNIVAADNAVAAALVAHPAVRKVSFTGSIQTGRSVMAAGAETLKRLTLELGGNDAAIVLPDTDLATAAPALFAAAMPASGQVCLAVKRVYAHRDIHDELVERLATLARSAVVGDGREPGVDIGPVQNLSQFEKLKGYLAEARSKGRVCAGGKALARPGYFIPPTIVADLSDDARLVREEQFGPILPVLAFDDPDDAVRRANAGEFGLGASVWTADVEAGVALALQLDAGAIWVNKHLDTPFDLSFSGAKQSGVGFAFGAEGLAAFTQSQIINVARTSPAPEVTA